MLPIAQKPVNKLQNCLQKVGFLLLLLSEHDLLIHIFQKLLVENFLKNKEDHMKCLCARTLTCIVILQKGLFQFLKSTSGLEVLILFQLVKPELF